MFLSHGKNLSRHKVVISTIDDFIILSTKKIEPIVVRFCYTMVGLSGLGPPTPTLSGNFSILFGETPTL